jgi:heme/copper-type cytochrome/quinol oxidase subunit 2
MNQDPVNPQPSNPPVVAQAVSPQPPQSTALPQTAPVNSNGLAIAGIILAVVVPLIGLIVSIVAFNKAKKANTPTTTATIGIALGIFLSMVSFFIFVSLVNAGYRSAQEKAKTLPTIQETSP